MKGTISELMDEQSSASSGQTCSAGRFVALAYTHARYHTHRAREVRLGNTPLESLSAERAEKVRGIRDEYERTFRDAIERGIADGFLTTREHVLAARAILQMGVGISLWFHPDEPLTSEHVGNVYAVFAMGLVGYDPEAHGTGCPDRAHCLAGTTWRDWSPQKTGFPLGRKGG
jgi:hypothetical protein